MGGFRQTPSSDTYRLNILEQTIKTITLSSDELHLAQFVGGLRTLIARGNNVRDAKMGDQDGLDADKVAFIAEYAYAKHFNVFPDFGLSPRSGSADGITNGKRYDVKATRRENGRLLATLKDNPDVDYYVLAIVCEPVVKLVGWAWKRDLFREENIIDLGHGNGYGLTQDKLRQF